MDLEEVTSGSIVIQNRNGGEWAAPIRDCCSCACCIHMFNSIYANEVKRSYIFQT